MLSFAFGAHPLQGIMLNFSLTSMVVKSCYMSYHSLLTQTSLTLCFPTEVVYTGCFYAPLFVKCKLYKECLWVKILDNTKII